jgi:hypothetical protein
LVPFFTRLSWFSALRRRFERSCHALVVAGDVRASFHENGIALLDLTTGKVFLSNETGSRIWRGLVAGLTPEAIGEDLGREFGVGFEIASRDTSSFLAELERRGLLIRKAVA